MPKYVCANPKCGYSETIKKEVVIILGGETEPLRCPECRDELIRQD